MATHQVEDSTSLDLAMAAIHNKGTMVDLLMEVVVEVGVEVGVGDIMIVRTEGTREEGIAVEEGEDADRVVEEVEGDMMSSRSLIQVCGRN